MRVYNFSPFNSLPLVQMGVTLSAQYHHPLLGRELFRNRLRSWQQSNDYAHPVQQDQRITIQFEENNNGTPVLDVINSEDGAIVLTPAITGTIAIPGNVDAAGDQIYTYQWDFRPDNEELDNGFYKLRLTSGYVATPDQFISEDFQVADSFPDTLAFACNHPINEWDTIFVQLHPKFFFRAPGYIESPIPDSDDVTFDDQEKRITKQNSEPFRKYRFIVAGNYGVPDWVVEKLNWFLAADKLRIEGNLFVKEEGTNWDIQDVDGYALSGAAIEVREENPMSPYQFSNALTLLMELPAYPFFIYELFIRDGFYTIPLGGLPIYDDTDRDNWLDYLNNTLTAENDQLGQYSIFAGKLYYLNTDGEKFILSSVIIFTDYMQLTVNVTNTGVPYTFSMANGKVGVDWLDGMFGTTFGTAILSPKSHLFGSTGSKTINIFHDNQLTAFASETDNANKLTNITGVSPAALLLFKIHKQDISGLLLPGILNNCVGLQSLLITSSHFIGFDSTSVTVFNQNLSGYPDLVMISFNDNELTTSYVDQFIAEMEADMDYTGGGVLWIAGQTPAAPPNASAAEFIAIDAAGWTIIHD